MGSNILVVGLGTIDESKFLKTTAKTQMTVEKDKPVHKLSLNKVKKMENWPSYDLPNIGLLLEVLLESNTWKVVKMINLIKRKGGMHPVISPRLTVTGRKMVLPPYPPGSYICYQRWYNQQHWQHEDLPCAISTSQQWKAWTFCIHIHHPHHAEMFHM